MKLTRRAVIAGAAGAAVLGFVAHFVRRRAFFDATHAELAIRGLDPAHDGVRVAHLTDVHVGLGTPDSRIRAAIETINDAQPDLVAITGDLVTSHIGTPLDRLDVLAGIQAPTVVTLGNHDYWQDAVGVRRRMEELGYPVLLNTHRVLQINGAPLSVLGIDDGYTGHADVDATFAGAPTEGSRLVLAHTPPTANDLPAGEGLVCLSGHTHGGQFVVPGITSRILRRLGQPYMAGFYPVRGNLLYVNRGLGFGRGGPPRLLAAPEVAFFTLRSA